MTRSLKYAWYNLISILIIFSQTFKNFKMDEEIACAICQKFLDNVNDVVTPCEKGSEGINRASRERNNLIQTVSG